MQIPDYATLRQRAGAARAEEVKRLTLLAVHLLRTLAWRIQTSAAWIVAVPRPGLRPVPVRNRRWPAPYQMPRDDIY